MLEKKKKERKKKTEGGEEDGRKIGQSDLPATTVRNIIGEDKILGVSADNLDEALKAQKDSSDYIGVGAM